MPGLDFTEDPATLASVALQRPDFRRWVSNIDRASSEPWVISSKALAVSSVGVSV